MYSGFRISCGIVSVIYALFYLAIGFLISPYGDLAGGFTILEVFKICFIVLGACYAISGIGMLAIGKNKFTGERKNTSHFAMFFVVASGVVYIISLIFKMYELWYSLMFLPPVALHVCALLIFPRKQKILPEYTIEAIKNFPINEKLRLYKQFYDKGDITEEKYLQLIKEL